jgi:hypothetical protein
LRLSSRVLIQPYRRSTRNGDLGGYRLSDLRTIRAESIGAERGAAEPWAAGLFDDMLEAMGPVEKLSGRHRAMVARYCEDVYRLMSEMARVLKPGGKAILIVGNSCLRGQFIRNSKGVIRAGKNGGFETAGSGRARAAT